VSALTQDEATTRRTLLDVHRYRVDLDLSAATTADDFTSTTVVEFDCSQPGAGTFIELKATRLEGAELNGLPLDPETTWADGRLALIGLREHNRLVVRAEFAYSRSGEGLHRFVDPEDGRTYLYSQAALDDAPRLFACFDQPDLKAVFTISVAAPIDWQVLANTRGEQTGSGRWEFAPTPPISTYLVAVVAGEYEGVWAEHDGIELGLWSRRSWRPALDVERLLATTRAGFDYFHRLFEVRYPLDTYHQVFVPELNFGAMENLGLVTIRDEGYLQRGTVTTGDRESLANVQLHEMAHMWFGDLVTMRWWDDLWLNESFADYLAHRALTEATEHTDAWTTFLAGRKAWGYRADQHSTTHPVAGVALDTADALLNFDGISYAKGASVLRQLVAWVGDEAFLTALRAHIREHAFGNATLDDLVGALARASGRDVAAWADRWLRTAGPSTLTARFAVGPDGRYAEFDLEQRSDELRPHRVNIGLYDVRDGELARRDAVPVDVGAATRTQVSDLRGAPSADLVLPNDGDLTYALVDLDERSVATVGEHLAGLTDPVARTLVWTTLGQMVERGRFAPSALVGLVIGALGPADPEPVAALVLRDVAQAADLWVAPERRADLLSRLATWAFEAARAAEPGGDRQLGLARTVARCAPEPTLATDWLAGREVPAGLVIDVDLRWQLVHRLATLGAGDAALVDAELRRDPSSSGELHAMAARAAMATPEAKEQAWLTVVEGTPSNHELVAIGQGFWQGGQSDLLAEYAQRFRDGLPRISDERSPQMVRLFATWLFPRTLIDPATLATAEALLARPGLSPAARRPVAEGRDDVRRGLLAMSADRVEITS
jgi:aminopeptidase N